MWCQILVWPTAGAENVVGLTCGCGQTISPTHFLGCFVTGSSLVHDRMNQTLYASGAKWGGGETRVTAFEPRHQRVGREGGDRRGPDGSFGDGRATTHWDMTGVSPLRNATWWVFLQGHCARFECDGRRGRNAIHVARHRKLESEDARLAKESGAKYVALVFLKSGGLHSDWLVMFKTLFPPCILDAMVAPQFGRQRVLDVVWDRIARTQANANFLSYQQNLQRSLRKLGRTTMPGARMGRVRAVVRTGEMGDGVRGQHRVGGEGGVADSLAASAPGGAASVQHPLVPSQASGGAAHAAALGPVSGHQAPQTTATACGRETAHRRSMLLAREVCESGTAYGQTCPSLSWARKSVENVSGVIARMRRRSQSAWQQHRETREMERRLKRV